MFAKDAEPKNDDRDVAPGEDTELTRARKLAERILTLLGGESTHERHDVRLTRALVEPWSISSRRWNVIRARRAPTDRSDSRPSRPWYR